ncbi:MAG: hypothetical protein IT258_01970 [Saprospiraceae bacterium]|nr:hypothetical protein [Saprospiraceae bacterium]
MRKRETFWITGFDFFEFNEMVDYALVDRLLGIYNVTSLPLQLKEYLSKFYPIDTSDSIFFTDDVKILSDGNNEVVLDSLSAINLKFDMFSVPFYSKEEYLYKILESDWHDVLVENKLFPICESVPNQDIVVSLNDGDTFGKLYSMTEMNDYRNFHEHPFCNSVFDFISGLKLVQL